MIYSGTAEPRSPGTTFRWGCFPARQTRSLLLLLTLSVASQSHGQIAQADEPPKTIRGTVVNAVTQAPIPRALVFSADNRYAMFSDGSGHFEFTLPESKPGTSGELGGTIYSSFGRGQSFRSGGERVWLTARKPGFLEEEQGGRRGAPGSAGEITISLVPEGLIKGRITLSSGDAALGMTVQLYSRQVQDGLARWTPSLSQRTNSVGEFRFAELLPGTYKLVTHELMDNDPITSEPGGQLYGFPPVYFPGVSDFAAASTIELAAGQTFEADLSATRQPYYPIKIPVANGSSTGMNVSVEGQRGPGYSLGYNAGDQIISGLLPKGNYTVEAGTYGPNAVSGTLNINVTGPLIEGAAMVLAPKSSIALDVKEEFNDTSWSGSGTWGDGKRTFALHGPRLYLHANVESTDDLAQARGASIRPPTGPDDNSLVLENLEPGKYWLRLDTSRGYVASATMGTTDLLRQPFTVGSGPSEPIEVKLRDDTAELDGSVTSIAVRSSVLGEDTASEGSGESVWVECVPLPGSSGQFVQFAVFPDGKFTNSTMAPGDYRVLAFAGRPPNLPYRDPEAMKAYETKGPVIHLAAGQKATVQVSTILDTE